MPHHAESGSLLKHGLLLAAYMLPVVFLAEHLAPPADYLIETLKAPVALGGLAIAVLVATPEAIGATKAAFHNQLQRAMNIFLGSVLATIGLTIPAMLLIGRLTGHTIFLGVEHGNLVLLLLTLFLSAITFHQRAHQYPAGPGACPAVSGLYPADFRSVSRLLSVLA